MTDQVTRPSLWNGYERDPGVNLNPTPGLLALSNGHQET